MAAIRVGIIGLSHAAKTSWASAAHLPYLKNSHGNYEITAVCNSSLESARSAIEFYDLPSTTNAYGNPQDLADDKNVDLVVCCTRVDLHYETIKPSIQQGKDVYVEWPLGSSLDQGQELAALVKHKCVKAMIGLQGRVSPVVLKIKSLLEQGLIGEVLSSSIIAAGGTRSRDSVPVGLKYFTEKQVGGNIVTIGFGHMIDYVNFILGEFVSFSSHLKIQRPQVEVVQDGKVLETVNSDVPDLVMLNGILPSDIPLSINFRRGQPFKDDPGFIWNIHGVAGEIKVQGPGPALQANDADVKIQLHTFAKDEVEEVKWESPFPDLPGPARNVAALYEAFADARVDQKRYPDFEDAVVRLQQIEDLYASTNGVKHGVWSS